MVFDPKLKGKTAMEDAWINSAIFTAMYLKNSENAKIEQPGNLTPHELGLVMEFLIKKKKDGQFRTFWSGWEQGVQLVANQEVWAMTGWEPIVYTAQSRGVKAYYAVPKEGYEGWGNNTILLKGAVDRGLSHPAHQFVNGLLDGYYGCKLGALRGYCVPTDRNVAYAERTRISLTPPRRASLRSTSRPSLPARFIGKTRAPTISSFTRAGGRSCATREPPSRLRRARPAGPSTCFAAAGQFSRVRRGFSHPDRCLELLVL